MAKRRRNNNLPPATPASNSDMPVSYAYVQSMARQQTVADCDRLVAEINERVGAIAGKLNSLRYS